jgi:hypothetical protein
VQTAAVLMQFTVVSKCKYYNFRTNGGGDDDDDGGGDDDDPFTDQHIFIRIRRNTARKCKRRR